MRPIEFVMNSKNLRKPEKGVEWNPTLPALELGSATGFTKGTIIPQKPQPTTIWSVGGTLRTPSATLHALLLSAEPANSCIVGYLEVGPKRGSRMFRSVANPRF